MPRRLASALASLEPRLPGDLEGEYRAHYLRADVNQFRFIVVMAVAALAAFVGSDYLADNGGPVFLALVAAKTGFAAASLLLAVYLGRIKRPLSYDLIALAWTLAYTILANSINMTRPGSYTGHFLADLLNVFSIYLVVPNSLLLRSMAGLFFTALVMLGLAVEWAQISQLDKMAVFICFAATNLLGLVISTRTNNYRRLEYKAGVELTEQKEELRELAKQREWLVRETNHRMKNNLMAVSSLLHLQAERSNDPTVRRLLDESRARLQSMKLIHEMLHQSKDLASVSLGDFLVRLAHALFSVYKSASASVELVEDLHDVEVDPGTASACGMIANELISNALKHAFPAGRPGSIKLGLRSAERSCEFSLNDDGIGLPPGLDPRGAASMGMQLVSLYVEQLGGTLVVDGRAGAAFTIRFPLRPREEQAGR